MFKALKHIINSATQLNKFESFHSIYTTHPFISRHSKVYEVKDSKSISLRQSSFSASSSSTSFPSDIPLPGPPSNIHFIFIKLSTNLFTYVFSFHHIDLINMYVRKKDEMQIILIFQYFPQMNKFYKDPSVIL